MEAIGKYTHTDYNSNAKIKVIAFRENNKKWINDPDKVQAKFKPNGEVIGFDFSNHYKYKVNSYLLFQPEYIESRAKESYDHYKIRSISNPINYQVYQLDYLFLNNLFINLDYLTSISDKLNDSFYVHYENKYYGPFIKRPNGIIPQVGKTVDVYEKLSIVKDGNINLVPDRPNPTKNIAFAETEKQIEEWFYSLIKDIEHPIFGFFREHRDWHNVFLEHFEVKDEANKVRLEMAVNMLDQMDLTYNQLRSLGEHSNSVKKVIDNKINECRLEIENELRPELEALILREDETLKNKKSEIAELEDLIKEKKKDVEKISEELKKIKSDFIDEKSRLQSKIQKIQVEVTDIENRRKELITNLKLSAEINNSDKPQNHTRLIQFSYLGEKEYPDFKSFVQCIRSSIKSFGIKGYDRPHLEDALYSIYTYNCIMGDSLEFILGVLHAFNKCHISYVNVEMNWLSFSFIEDLKIHKMFKEAANDSGSLHVLILRDINLSSPECFLRPILDFNDDLIPAPIGDVPYWPDNFKLIGVIQKTPEVGMPILESTFRGWKGLLQFEPTFVDRAAFSENHYMSMPYFKKHFAKYPYEGKNYLHDYTSVL